MTHGVFRVPTPKNEPVRGYAPGSPERASLAATVSPWPEMPRDPRHHRR